MSDDKLRPELAVSILRAKAAELDNQAMWLLDPQHLASAPERGYLNAMLGTLTANMGLIAQLLADHIEENQTVRITGPEASGTKYAPPSWPLENRGDDG